ncbi:MAG: LytTR family DNA-binding domain-containing protein [Lachnospiraceae bacterium]|nr:LytTR family DNA-binding domain-containing protein [Lachnospiraceae bacterium]
MLKIILCDDNPAILKAYSELIRKIAGKNKINIHISTYCSGEELLFHIPAAKEPPDIIYLDILMNSLNGIDTAKKLRAMGCLAEIIFLTASEDYIFDSFDVRPTQYIVKDSVTKGRFEEIFLSAVKIAQDDISQKFIIKTKTSKQVIPLRLISHFELYKRVITIYYGESQTLEYYSSMSELEDQLKGKNFLRTHRSYLVHLPYITKFEKEGVTLIDHTFVPIGRTYYEKAKKSFLEYITHTNMYLN